MIAGKENYHKINKAADQSMKSGMQVTNVKALGFDSLTDYMQSNSKVYNQQMLDDSGWNLGSETEQQLLKKLQQAGISLEKYVDGNIYYGIKTGLNEAFVIDDATKKRLIIEDKRSAEIIKSFLGGRDIKRYQAPKDGKHIILFPKGFTNKKGSNPKNGWKWLKENYPALTNHLEPFTEKGEKRYDKGDYWWELRTCEYYEEFEKPKIIIPAIVKEASYTYDKAKFYSNDKTCIIPTEDLYLLGIMSSKACDYYLKSIASTKQGGYFEYKPMYISKLPIPKGAVNQKAEIIKLVDQLLQLNEEKRTATLQTKIDQLQDRIDHCEQRINAIVYELYGLSKEEIAVIEAA